MTVLGSKNWSPMSETDVALLRTRKVKQTMDNIKCPLMESADDWFVSKSSNKKNNMS